MRTITVVILVYSVLTEPPETWVVLWRWLGEPPQNAVVTPFLPALMIAVVYLLSRRRKAVIGFCRQDSASQKQKAQCLAEDVEKQLATGDNYTELQRVVMSMGLLGEPALLPRVLEWYRLDQGVIHRWTALEGVVPEDFLSDAEFAHGQPTGIYVPVLVATKGHLTSNFEAYDAEGRRLTVLTFAEYIHFAGTVLRMLLRTAYNLVPDAALPDPAGRAERNALKVLALKEAPAQTDLDEVLSSIQDLLPAPIPLALDQAVDFVSSYADRHALVVPVRVDSDRKFRVSYELTLAPEPEKSLTGRVAALLDSSPVKFEPFLLNASRCESYHLQIKGPGGMYVARQNLINAPEGVAYYCRFRLPSGDAAAHFYAQSFPNSSGDSLPQVVVEYQEIPPGSTFRAAIAAAASFVLILAVGLFGSRKGSALSTDAAAFLLVFPALAAAWMGYESPAGAVISQTALISRLSLFLTTLCSLGASIAAVAYKEFPKADDDVFEWPLFGFGFEPFGVDDLWWGILLIVIFTNALVMCYAWLARVFHYSRLPLKS